MCALSCATPAERFACHAAALGFETSEVTGVRFQHLILSRDITRGAPVIHVYLGGDGSPARAARQNPPDPTPATDPLLKLMSLDPAPRMFLGRPCYHRAEDTAEGCDPIHWTLGRYGEPVVTSMVEALEQFRADRGINPQVRWVLVGFSGGATLATLMAERLPNARALVTLAGNFDTGAWTEHHGYHALTHSLDPSKRPPLREDLVQFHLRGGRDKNVLPEFSREFIARQPNAREYNFPEFDHTCCWEHVWGQTLKDLGAAIALEGHPSAEREGVQ